MQHKNCYNTSPYKLSQQIAIIQKYQGITLTSKDRQVIKKHLHLFNADIELQSELTPEQTLAYLSLVHAVNQKADECYNVIVENSSRKEKDEAFQVMMALPTIEEMRLISKSI